MCRGSGGSIAVCMCLGTAIVGFNLAAATVVWATVGPQEPATHSATQLVPTPKPPRLTRNVDFPGGKLADYVPFLRTLFPALNVLVEPKALDAPVPRLSLPTVAAPGAVRVLEFAGDQAFVVQTVPQDRASDAPEIFVIGLREPRATETSTTTRPPTTHLVYRVHAISNIIGGSADKAGEDKLIGAISGALAMPGIGSIVRTRGPDKPPTRIDGGPEPHLKIHDGLLMFAGSDTQADILGKVLAEYSKGVRAQPTTPESGTAARLERLENLIRDLQAELERMKRQHR